MTQTVTTNPAAVFFLAHYVLWVVGQLEAEVAEQLDAMTPPEVGNWRNVMARRCQWTSAGLRARFNSLCSIMTDEEALDVLLHEVGLEKS